MVNNVKNKSTIFFSIALFLVSAVTAFFLTLNSNQLKNYSYVIGCSVYNKDLEPLVSHHGVLCDFLNNGQVLMANDKSVMLLDQHEQIVWKKDEYVHHALSAVDNYKSIVYLSDEDQMFNGDLTRFDVIKKVSMENAEVQAEWKLFEHQEEILKALPWKYVKKDHLLDRQMGGHPHSKAMYEFLHFNSIYEIPKNEAYPKLPYMKPGNFIVSAGISLILFFDNHLNLIHTKVYDDISYTTFHDVQVLPDGQMLIYHNAAASFWCSRLEVVDSESLKPTWTYQDESLEKLCSNRFGSVQLLPNGNFLFSDVSSGGRVVEINKEGLILNDFFHPEKDPITQRPLDIYKVKAVDLTDFFKSHTKL